VRWDLYCRERLRERERERERERLCGRRVWTHARGRECVVALVALCSSVAEGVWVCGCAGEGEGERVGGRAHWDVHFRERDCVCVDGVCGHTYVNVTRCACRVCLVLVRGASFMDTQSCDQTRPDQTRRDLNTLHVRCVTSTRRRRLHDYKIYSRETRLIPNQTRSYQTRPGQIRPDQNRPDQTR
jgi:hypothetical protein